MRQFLASIGSTRSGKAVQAAFVSVMIGASGAFCALFVSVPIGQFLFGVGLAGVVISGIFVIAFSIIDRKR